MRRTTLVMLAVGMLLTLCVAGALAKDDGMDRISAVPLPDSHSPAAGEFRGERPGTLWIFDATFENTIGDNAGWTTSDQSGTLGMTNYWHRDTVRSYYGDWNWWCGTYNSCWRQPRGYGNDWNQSMWRNFPEVAANTVSGDLVQFEFDQRFALEHDYDYGYLDISNNAGSTWTTAKWYSNPGFAGKPGTSQNWTSPTFGHQVIDFSTYAGQTVMLRFRVFSDGAYSSQDQYNNPPNNSCLDGAWMVDNLKWKKNGTQFWFDNVEGGENGWQHPNISPSGQTGVVFFRGLYGTDFVTGRPFTCPEPGLGNWMYAAVDPVTSQMVDGENTWLVSPPIDISGAAKLIGQWTQWVDLPQPANDIFNLRLASNDIYECVTDPAGFVDEAPGAWFGGPFWGTWTDNWDAFAGNDWLAIRWELYNDDTPTVPHMAGIFCDRQRVGVPSGDAGTAFNLDEWNNFNDWFQEQIAEALLDTLRLEIRDDDNVASAYVVASDDEGATWESYPMRREDPAGNWWLGPPPVNQMAAGSIIRYYFSMVDGVGNTATYPSTAPDNYYEFSILPTTATPSNPGLLLVDKHGRRIPSEQRDYFHTSEYYFREALGILGYEWEKYDVEVPSGSNDQSDGPDSVAYKYYSTQIWFSDEFDTKTIKRVDQKNLIQWLNQAGSGKERNLLLSGNDIGYELMATGIETLSFYETWLATQYVDNAVGSVTTDSVPGLEDRAGSFNFMTYGDKKGVLQGGCPILHNFDVIQPYPGIVGTETVADYVKADLSKRPAGVAYTHQTLGYQTVNLGFGMEFMMDGVVGSASNYTPEGYHKSGIADRADLMGNIMEYFALTPSGTATGVDEGSYRSTLSNAYPNPFNPVTKISYSIREAGPVTIEVYSIAGKVVRTLLDTKLEAGASGYVVWDGLGDDGEKCASGVYFYRLNAPGHTETQKMVMLK